MLAEAALDLVHQVIRKKQKLSQTPFQNKHYM